MKSSVQQRSFACSNSVQAAESIKDRAAFAVQVEEASLRALHVCNYVISDIECIYVAAGVLGTEHYVEYVCNNCPFNNIKYTTEKHTFDENGKCECGALNLRLQSNAVHFSTLHVITRGGILMMYKDSSSFSTHRSSFRYLYTVGLLSSHTLASSLTFSFSATNAG